jgi:hypothetical protein
VINGSGAVKAASVRVVSRRKQIENGSVFSVQQAAAACNASPPVVRRWLSLGLLSAPPWTVEQLRRVRDVTDPQRHRLGSGAAHGTMARWNSGCSCARCRQMQSNAARARGRRKAQERLSPEMRQRLLDAICAGKPFRRALRHLGLTSNQIWGLTKTDTEWLAAFDAALTAPAGTAPMRPRSWAVCAKSAESISESAWLGIANRQGNFGSTSESAWPGSRVVSLGGKRG